MLYVARNREIILNWYLYEGTNKRIVDFTEIPGCRPTAFLVNKKGQYTYRLEYQVDASAIPFVRIVIPKDSLAPDIYDMKIVWEVPEEKDIRLRLRHNNRFLAVSHIARVMKVTANITEDNTGLPAGQTLVRTVKSLSESFGYDGLSAYELAVLRKGYTGTEEEFIAQFERVPPYRTTDTDAPDDERAISSLRAYRDFIEKDRVVKNSDIDEQDTEDSSRVPTAYALKHVKDLITPISGLQGVGVLSKAASGWEFTDFPKGLELGTTSDTAYAGDKGVKNEESIEKLNDKVGDIEDTVERLPETVASKEELSALEKRVNQHLLGVGTTLESINKELENKTDKEDIASAFTPTGDELRPIYLNQDGKFKEVSGLSVPNSIESTQGGISAKGIADFGATDIGETVSIGGASSLEGLDDVTIESPENGHLLIYDTEKAQWVNKSNPFKLPDFGEGFRNKGNTTLPVYMDANGIPQPIIGINVDKDITSRSGGVSAKGVADFTAIGGGGGISLGSNVSIDIKQVEGVNIADLIIDGTVYSIFSPSLGKYDDFLNKFINVGSQKLPIFFDKDGNPKTVTGISVPNNIESTSGGVSARGIADYNVIGTGGGVTIGSSVAIDIKQTDGINIADFTIDGNVYSIYSPDLGKYDDFIGSLKERGNKNLPVYFDKNGEAQPIDGLLVRKDIMTTEGGVSAKGVADFGIGEGAIGGSRVVVVPVLGQGRKIAKIFVDDDEYSIYSPDISGKVDKEDGKGLSSNDYTDEDKSKISQIDKKLDKEIYNNHINSLKNKGNKTRPVFFDDTGRPDVIDGLIVPDDIQSLNGGVSAKGVADFGSGSRGGSQVSITQKVNSGNAIADVVIDGETTTLYSPVVDLSGKVDKETGKGLSSNDFTDQEKEKLRTLNNYNDTSIWKEVNKKVDKNNVSGKGSEIRPIYFNDNAEAQEVIGINVPGNIESTNGGVSAKGIADFGTPSGTGGTGGISVLRDDEVANVTSEDVTEVASAYAVKKIRDIINIDDVEEFSEDKDYGRGNLVRRGDRLYRFFYNHSKGAWASGDVEPVNITTLSTPLSITENDLIQILK